MKHNIKDYKGFYNIIKNEASKEATIYIYGVIGGYDWETGETINSANKFVQDFKATETIADIIHIEINSPGGSVWDGLPIYNVIKNSKKTIYTYVDGIAYSMGALIALAGDKVYGYRNSMFMVHNASNYAWGNANDMRKTADELDKCDLALGTIIEEKLGITADEVSEKYMNYEDNYFVGDEAEEIGFFDEIITSEKANVPTDLKEMSPTDILNHYSKMNFTDFHKPSNNQNSNNNMSKEIKAPSIQNALGYETPFQATDEGVFLQEAEVNTLETALTSANNATAQVQGNLDTANTTVTDAATVIDAALVNAEIEVPTNTTLSEKITLLNNQRNEFAGKSAKKTTTVNSAGDKPPTGGTPEKVYAHNEAAKRILNQS